MKKIYAIVVALMSLASMQAQSALDNPRIAQMDLTAAELAHYMAPGWNLGNTMEGCSSNDVFTNKGGLWNETSWQSAKTTKAFISLLKKKGFKSIRIPCGWVAGHLTSAASYDGGDMTLDPTWLARVKEIIDYCLEENLYVIINDHWDGGWLEYDGFTDQTNVSLKKEQLYYLWKNIATALRDYDERVLFAGLNEPGVGGASPKATGTKLKEDSEAFAKRLLEYEQVFIDAVRETKGNNAKRVLIVQAPKTEIDLACTSYYDITNKSIRKLFDYADKRLMVEVHFYEPYDFCQMNKDESWGKVKLYWKGHAPSGNWDQTCNTIWYNNQNVDATQHIQNLMNKMKMAFVDKGMPVIIGEFGANRKNASSYGGDQGKHDESITAWYSLAASVAMKAGAVPFVWDTNNQGFPHMTIFNRATPAVTDTYIYKGVMEGVKNGKAAFEQIYPAPSQQTTSIKEVSLNGNVTQVDSPIYRLDGTIVRQSVTDSSTHHLAPGIYIYKGQKHVVK